MNQYPRLRCLPVLCLCLSLIACSESGDPASPRLEFKAGDSRAVARIGEREITAQELDEALKLQLYDLELARYELRSGQLAAMIGEISAGGEQPVEIHLAIPEPPRIQLPDNRRRVLGNPQAPVTIAVFCSYQSPHCKSIQPALRRLASDYSGWTLQLLYDLPLKFHRQGTAAAQAARCAEVQGALWRYQDGLYAYTRALSDEVFGRLAKQLDLDTGAFKACMEGDTHKDAIASDVRLARDLGLKNVPVVFINGLYIRGPQSFAYYAQWVERELGRLGFNPDKAHAWSDETVASGDLPVSRLPLTLVGVRLSSEPEDARALLQVREQRARAMGLGGEILEGVTLAEIHRRFVVIYNRGAREKLPLRGRDGASVPLTASTVRDAETLRQIEQPLGEGSRKLVDASGVLPLGQAWLAQQLQNRTELEKKFVQAEMEVEGYHLMRLEGIADSEFFTALGFEENDVVLRVNDSWVHSGQNSLWDALTSGEVVDVAFMRGGLPQRLQYVVAESGYFEESPADAETADSDEGQREDNTEDEEG